MIPDMCARSLATSTETSTFAFLRLGADASVLGADASGVEASAICRFGGSVVEGESPDEMLTYDGLFFKLR